MQDGPQPPGRELRETSLSLASLSSLSQRLCLSAAGVQKLRHVKLARQAMVFWQSYDAFARICMSIGVNQLLNAASYFILAYYMSEVKVPSSATYGVLVACSCCLPICRSHLQHPA